MSEESNALAQERIAVAQLQRETMSSIELKRNAKGEYAWDVKVYFDADVYAEAETALSRLRHLDQKLRGLFIVLPKEQGKGEAT